MIASLRRAPFLWLAACVTACCALIPTRALAQDTAPVPGDVGVVLVAHGSTPEWNARVEEVAARVRATLPAEVAYLMGSEQRDAPEAYDRLVNAGVRRVVVVPLLVSSHSAHAEQVRFIGGLRDDYPHAEHMMVHPIRGSVPVVGVASGLDDHPLVAAILTDRARELSRDPRAESLVIVAHGPNADADAAVWTTTIQSLARQVRTEVPFREIDVRLLRDDAPKPVKDKALAELRASVDTLARQGRVAVVPLLIGAGRVAGQIPDVLDGLPFEWNGRPILPDDRVADWVVSQVRGVVAAQPSSSSRLPTREELVVVTATRTERARNDIPVQTDVIDRQIIEATGARSVADVLSHELGIEVVPTLAGEGVQLQGVDSGGVLVLVDGQEVIGKVSGSVDVANLLVGDVERIEIVKGAGSALYGSDALGGVVNILTRRASSPFSLTAEQRFESLDGRTTMVSIGGQRGGWNGRVSASRVSRDAYDLTPEEPTTSGSGYRKADVSARAGYTRGVTELSLLTRYYDEDAADVTVSRGVNFDDLVFDERLQTIAEFRTKPSAPATLTVRGHVSRYSHNYERVNQASGAATPDLTRERLGEIEAQYDHAIGSHLLSFGTEFERAAMTSDRIVPERRDLDSAVGFIQDEWFLHDRVNLVAGVRFDRSSAFGSAWSPKAAVLVRPIDGVRLRASYGEGFKAPEFKDLYYAFPNRAAGYQIVGNADLQAETSRSLSGGVEVDLWNQRASVSVTAFRHRIRDLIDYALAGMDPATGLLTFRSANVGRVGTQGVDTDLTVRPASWATFAVGYAHLSATDRETGEPLTGRSRHTIKARMRLTSARLGLNAAIFGRFVGRRAFADTDVDGRIDDFSPALHLWDARVGQRLGPNLELFVGAENLLNERDVRYYPTAGRRVYTGIAVNLER